MKGWLSGPHCTTGFTLTHIKLEVLNCNLVICEPKFKNYFYSPQNDTIEMGNDSYLEEPGQSSGAAGQALAQQDNPDPDNDADNDADLSVDAEPAMEQQVSFQNLFKSLASAKN